MLFCHVTRTDSLRETCNGLMCCLGKLVHLRIRQRPNKSRLSYANARRHDAKVFGLLRRLVAESIVVMDRACNDFKQFTAWTREGTYFVDRTGQQRVEELSICHGQYGFAFSQRKDPTNSMCNGVLAHRQQSSITLSIIQTYSTDDASSTTAMCANRCERHGLTRPVSPIRAITPHRAALSTCANFCGWSSSTTWALTTTAPTPAPKTDSARGRTRGMCIVFVPEVRSGARSH